MSRSKSKHRAVAATLANGRIGQPVFVRYLLYTHDPASMSEQAEDIAHTLNEWFGQPLECRHSIYRDDICQLSKLMVGDSSLALVSIAQSELICDAIDLTVLGTRGAIYDPVELSP